MAFGWPVTNFEKYNLGNAISCKLGIKFLYAVLVTLKDLEIVAQRETPCAVKRRGRSRHIPMRTGAVMGNLRQQKTIKL